jgi:pimeloyl-ACP methyl ester carboxylesterase
MATARVNSVRLFYEIRGNGNIPLILVHGSWCSHVSWQLVVPGLAESFRVLSYDRRGHSASERPAGHGSVDDDVADLAALIEHLQLGPAWVVGNSFGASITLRLAAERPKPKIAGSDQCECAEVCDNTVCEVLTIPCPPPTQPICWPSADCLQRE